MFRCEDFITLPSVKFRSEIFRAKNSWNKRLLKSEKSHASPQIKCRESENFKPYNSRLLNSYLPFACCLSREKSKTMSFSADRPCHIAHPFYRRPEITCCGLRLTFLLLYFLSSVNRGYVTSSPRNTSASSVDSLSFTSQSEFVPLNICLKEKMAAWQLIQKHIRVSTVIF